MQVMVLKRLKNIARYGHVTNPFGISKDNNPRNIVKNTAKRHYNKRHR